MDSVLIYFSGIYLGVVTPGRLGEFIKILYLKLEKGISMAKGITSVLADRLFDMYLLLIMGIIGIWQFNVLGKLSNTYFALIIVVILTPLLFLNKKLVRKLLSLLYYSFIFKRFEGRIEETFEDFYKGVNQLINLRLINSAFLTCVSYLIFYIQCYLLVIAMGLQIDFITIALFMSISNLISFIPISISGLGTRDATLVYLFSLIGLRAELAVGYAFLVFIVFFVFGGLMGAVAWWIKPLNLNIKKDC